MRTGLLVAPLLLPAASILLTTSVPSSTCPPHTYIAFSLALYMRAYMYIITIFSLSLPTALPLSPPHTFTPSPLRAFLLFFLYLPPILLPLLPVSPPPPPSPLSLSLSLTHFALPTPALSLSHFALPTSSSLSLTSLFPLPLSFSLRSSHSRRRFILL